MYQSCYNNNEIILQSPTSKVHILPTCGAMLNNWIVDTNEGSLQIIDGYEDFEDFDENCESKGFRSSKLSPFVCRLNNSQFEWQSQLYKINGFELSGHAIHGLLYRKAFKVIRVQSSAMDSMAIMEYNFSEENSGYPFSYKMVVTYVLEEDNKLNIQTQITNKNNEPMPITDGWHPYFKLGKPIDELQLSVYANSQVVFNDALIPTGELLALEPNWINKPLLNENYDNCYLLQKPLINTAVELTDIKTGNTIKVYTDDSCPFIQIYTPPHRQSIAIENLSAAPDAFNNKLGLIELDAQESITFYCMYQFIAG